MNHLLIAVAEPYAKAAYEYAKEQHAVDEWATQLLHLKTYISDKNIINLLDHPLFPQCDIIDFIFDIASPRFSLPVKNIALLIAQRKRLSIIPAVYNLFLQYLRDDKKIKQVTIISALLIDKTLIQSIKKKFQQKYQCFIEITQQTDSSLLGGLKIEIDDYVFDGSIKNSLYRLGVRLNDDRSF